MQAEQTWIHTDRKECLVRVVLGHHETDMTLAMITQPASGADSPPVWLHIYQSRAEPGSLCVQGDCICRHPRRTGVINEMLSLGWEQKQSLSY